MRQQEIYSYSIPKTLVWRVRGARVLKKSVGSFGHSIAVLLLAVYM